MKILLLLLAYILNISPGVSQTYDEWFRQEKTKEKYLLEQIAALRMFAGYAAKGYSIVTKGIATVEDIKRGDLSLHNNFFHSLSAVSPAVKQYAVTGSIIAGHSSAAKQLRRALQFSKGAQLTAGERKYTEQVITNLLASSSADVEALLDLLTNDNRQMNDHERIRRIDQLYASMQDRNDFLGSFSNAVKILSLQRKKEALEVHTGKKLNAIKK